MVDVVIVGGGVIGLTAAWELAGAGVRTAVLDQSEPGREASWAGAGMIPPGDVNHSVTHDLAALSAQRWPEISAALRRETGIDNGYRRCGGLLLEHDGQSNQDAAAAWSRLHLPAELVRGASLRELAPAMNPAIDTAVWLSEMAQVRNPHHLRGLKQACISRGVQLYPGQRVVRWEIRDHRVQAAVTADRTFAAAEFLVAAGAWSGELLAPLGLALPIAPVHGQIVLLRAAAPIFATIIERGKQYLVPRADGRILVGATEERIGFQKRNTPEAVEALLNFARATVPALATVPVETTWSGLRPWSAEQHPRIGRAPGYDNLLIAAGHFRAGLSNSPGTALVLRQLILGEPPNIDLSGLSG